MNADGSIRVVGEVIVNYLHERGHNLIWWSRPINEKQIIMSNPIISESLFIIKWIIESDYPSNVDVLEDLNIFVWVMAVPLLRVSLIKRAHESSKLLRNDPVHVTIFYSLVVLVLFDYERFELVPAEFQSPF